MKNIKSIIIFALVNLLISLSTYAQTPERINYQAVARDLSGNPLVSQPLPSVVFEIRQGSSSGTVVYRETQALSTNQFGLFTAEIGGGTPSTGTFSAITWGLSSYYLQITIGTDVMPATQLLSVPYALYSKESLNGPSGANGHDNLSKVTAEPAGVNCPNGGNMVETGVDDNGNGTLDPLEVDFTYYVCDGGSSSGDNWGTDVVNITGSNITGDGTVGSPLTVTESDPSATNEIQSLTQAGNVISLSSGGGSVTLTDIDPNNERITAFGLNTGSDSLVIVEAGARHAFALSNLSDGDWTKGTGNDIYNNTDSVGIGTTDPKSLLQLGNYMHLFSLNMAANQDYSVLTYNTYWDGTTIRNTTGGKSGISLIGEDNGEPIYSVLLFPDTTAGGDIMALDPMIKMTLKGKGLGINKDNPDAALHISSADSAVILLDHPDDGSQASLIYSLGGGRALNLQAPPFLASGSYALTYPTGLPATGGSSLVSDLSGNLSWKPVGSSLWIEPSAGQIIPVNTTDYVGIGTSSPTRKLHVNDNSANPAVFIQQVGSGAGLSVYSNTSSSTQFVFQSSSLVGGLDGFNIKGNGHVGIGTKTPSLLLEVNQPRAKEVPTTGSTARGIARFSADDSPLVMDMGVADDAYLGGWIQAHRATNMKIQYPLLLNPNGGNVGVGTTSPGMIAGSNQYLTIFNNGPYAAGSITSVELKGNTNGRNSPAAKIDFLNGIGTNNIARIESRTAARNTGQGQLLFYTNNGRLNERMRINEDGEIGIGTANPSFSLHLGVNSAAKPISNTWTVASDARLKTNVKPYVGGLEDVLKINPVWFTYNGKAGMPKETGVGVIAQELQEIAPFMISEWEYKEEDITKKYLGVDNGAMTYMLINAIKEQQKMIEELRTKLEKLKNK